VLSCGRRPRSPDGIGVAANWRLPHLSLPTPTSGHWNPCHAVRRATIPLLRFKLPFLPACFFGGSPRFRRSPSPPVTQQRRTRKSGKISRHHLAASPSTPCQRCQTKSAPRPVSEKRECPGLFFPPARCIRALDKAVLLWKLNFWGEARAAFSHPPLPNGKTRKDTQRNDNFFPKQDSAKNHHVFDETTPPAGLIPLGREENDDFRLSPRDRWCRLPTLRA